MPFVNNENKLTLTTVAIRLDELISEFDRISKTDNEVGEALDYFKVWQKEIMKLMDKIDRRLKKLENSHKKNQSKR